MQAGESYRAVAAAVGCCTRTIQLLLRPIGGMPSRRQPLPAVGMRGPHLSFWEREEISRGLVADESCHEIAARLGRRPSSISREVARRGGRHHYRAWQAEAAARAAARRPKARKLTTCRRLCGEVERRLEQRWSPQQIAARLVTDHPDDPEMRVSHETIYQSLFVQGRGALRAELHRCLRTGARSGRPAGRVVRGTGASGTWCCSASDRPRSRTERCPGTGKAT